MIKVSLKQIPHTVNVVGRLWIDGLCIFERAKGKRFELDGNSLILRDVPKFSSARKWENWLNNHFPKKAAQRFLTAALKMGKVKVSVE